MPATLFSSSPSPVLDASASGFAQCSEPLLPGNNRTEEEEEEEETTTRWREMAMGCLRCFFLSLPRLWCILVWAIQGLMIDIFPAFQIMLSIHIMVISCVVMKTPEKSIAEPHEIMRERRHALVFLILGDFVYIIFYILCTSGPSTNVPEMCEDMDCRLPRAITAQKRRAWGNNQVAVLLIARSIAVYLICSIFANLIVEHDGVDVFAMVVFYVHVFSTVACLHHTAMSLNGLCIGWGTPSRVEEQPEKEERGPEDPIEKA